MKKKSILIVLSTACLAICVLTFTACKKDKGVAPAAIKSVSAKLMTLDATSNSPDWVIAGLELIPADANAPHVMRTDAGAFNKVDIRDLVFQEDSVVEVNAGAQHSAAGKYWITDNTAKLDNRVTVTIKSDALLMSPVEWQIVSITDHDLFLQRYAVGKQSYYLWTFPDASGPGSQQYWSIIEHFHR